MLSVRAAEFCKILYFVVYLCITPVSRDDFAERKHTASGGMGVRPYVVSRQLQKSAECHHEMLNYFTPFGDILLLTTSCLPFRRKRNHYRIDIYLWQVSLIIYVHIRV